MFGQNWTGDKFLGKIGRATNFWGKIGRPTNFGGKIGRVTKKSGPASHFSDPSLYAPPCSPLKEISASLKLQNKPEIQNVFSEKFCPSSKKRRQRERMGNMVQEMMKYNREQKEFSQNEKLRIENELQRIDTERKMLESEKYKLQNEISMKNQENLKYKNTLLEEQKNQIIQIAKGAVF